MHLADHYDNPVLLVVGNGEFSSENRDVHDSVTIEYMIHTDEIATRIVHLILNIKDHTLKPPLMIEQGTIKMNLKTSSPRESCLLSVV
jgi:hypothetical protein